MKHVHKNRAIIAAMIHGGPGMADINHLKSCAIAVFNATGSNFDLLSKGKAELTVTVEGMKLPPTVDTDFGLTIGWCQLADLELGITTIENPGKGKNRSRSSGPDKPTLMLGIGSREFCMAFAHLWATSSDKQNASQWGFHMIRKLATSLPRLVIWYDTEDDKLTCGDASEMYSAMKNLVTAAT
ncbi:hypothetical protein KW783_02390 [Candidatus Parcubacteria bacterium]|nr:hypothetical protein [Candidatus Parcubacteria bacterium]